MRRFGFTGTRNGLSSAQLDVVRELLQSDEQTEIHHGGCVGADAQIHSIAIQTHAHIFVHPASDVSLRWKAQLESSNNVTILPARPALVRNHDIMDAGVDGRFGFPFGMKEELRSGTWSAIRYAHKLLPSRLVIVFPDGTKKRS